MFQGQQTLILPLVSYIYDIYVYIYIYIPGVPGGEENNLRNGSIV